MASPTKNVKGIRKAKDAKAGKKRKAKIRNHGTTKSKAELFGDE